MGVTVGKGVSVGVHRCAVALISSQTCVSGKTAIVGAEVAFGGTVAVELLTTAAST